MLGYSGRVMVKGAFGQQNTSSKPPLGFKLCSTTRSEPIETKTSIQCLDGKSSEWIEKDWINDRMACKIRSNRRRVAWFKDAISAAT